MVQKIKILNKQRPSQKYN